MLSCCLQTESFFFRNQWDIHGIQTEPLLSHIASSGPVLWVFLCQKTAIFSQFLAHFVVRIQVPSRAPVYVQHKKIRKLGVFVS